ncbi:MAG: hypothetical protein NUW22_04835 [Acidobacteria bacterium]|nr:hypothetical protein [Acidobacteriota bacterium]
MSGTLSPVGPSQFFDDDGDPLAAGLLYTYVAGSSTPATTYSDSALSTANANPIVLDGAGRCTIYLDSASYKFVLKDADLATIWTQDNISSVALGQSVLGEVFTFGGEASTPITDTTYPSGATYDKLMSGSAILSVDSANLVGTYAIAGMLLSNAGVTVTVALVNLSDGSPDTPIATISSTHATGERVISGAITFPAAGASKNFGIKAKVSSGTAFGWALSLQRLS